MVANVVQTFSFSKPYGDSLIIAIGLSNVDTLGAQTPATFVGVTFTSQLLGGSFLKSSPEASITSASAGQIALLSDPDKALKTWFMFKVVGQDEPTAPPASKRKEYRLRILDAAKKATFCKVIVTEK